MSDQIRRAILDCGLTRYAVSKAAGIDQSTLTRFMSGERGLPMKTLDVLAGFLRLRIVMDGPKGRTAKKGG